jgi:galactose-1-phosphate uridylyltransferase
MRPETLQRRRLIAENDDFACLAPFASGYPFEACVFPKVHSSAFSRTSAVQIENLAKILRDVLQKLDHTLGGPPYNLSLQDRPFLRPHEGYWKTIEEDFHWHLEIFPQLVGLTGLERPPGSFTTRCPRKLPPNVSPVDKRRSQPPGVAGHGGYRRKSNRRQCDAAV